MLTAAANCYNSCYQNWTMVQAAGNDFTTVCSELANWLFKGPVGDENKSYGGQQCQMIFERYKVVYHQLGVPAQTLSRELAGTLSSANYGILNTDVGNLGHVLDANATVTSGEVHYSKNASAYALPIKYAPPWNITLWPTGHCYTPLQALPGYSGAASTERSSVALPTAQALAKLQLLSNDPLLADQLNNAISALQNAAEQQAPSVNLATVLLTITTCLGTLTATKILELYTDLWSFVKVTRARSLHRFALVVMCTTVVLVFAVAPPIAMLVQDHLARTTPFSTTYGNFIQFDVPGTESTTLSIVSATVTYVQNTRWWETVVAVAVVLFAISVGWWLYATWHITTKMHVRYKEEHVGFNEPRFQMRQFI